MRWWNEMDEEKKEIPVVDSLAELYMINRREMLVCNGSFEVYNRLMESISIGDALLGNGHTLSDKVNELLGDTENYPKARDMNYQSTHRVYTCSAGDGNTGTINVRPDELEIGETSLINQQANTIIRKIKPVDRQLFRLIVEKGLIKKLSIHDSIEKDIISSLMEELDG